jgi:hypothetical protein
MNLTWIGKKPGDSITGEFQGFRAYRYSTMALLKIEGKAQEVTMPGDLREKLHGISLGTVITIQYKGRTPEATMTFDVAVEATNRDKIGQALGGDVADYIQCYISDNYEYVETLLLNDLLRRGGSHDCAARLLTGAAAAVQIVRRRVLAYIKNNPDATYNDMVEEFIAPLVDKIDALKAKIETTTIDMETSGEITVTERGAMAVMQRKTIEHINGDPRDCRRANLRVRS